MSPEQRLRVNKMKILLLGKNGQLGWELNRSLQSLGEVVALDYPEVNLADAKSIRKTVEQFQPEVIYNATAYTAVDKAESEPESAEAINGTGPGILAEEARKINAVLIHYSTDYVFDGNKGSPYIETDPPNPINVYGLTKLHGEQAIQQVDGVYLIFRTSWVYSLRQGGFVTKALEWARAQKTLCIVDDQIGSPTWARMLAETTALLLARAGHNCFTPWLAGRKGLYHLAGNGYASRLDWTEAILELDKKHKEQIVEKILPARTSDFPTPAQRPLFSALDCSKFEQTFNLRLPAWQTALKLALDFNDNSQRNAN
jgi:dTDP-4-dehydrorhamnose reductase